MNRPSHTKVSAESEGAKALLLIDGTNMVVTTRRGDDAPQAPGLVDLPGGRIEPGETPYDACLREVLEEIGIDVSNSSVVSADAQITSGGKLSWLIAITIPPELADAARPISEAKELIIEDVTTYLNRSDAWLPFQNHARKVVSLIKEELKGPDSHPASPSPSS